MREVFADTLFWIAITVPGDQYAQAAKSTFAQLGRVRIVTTDEVLTEYLAALCWPTSVRRVALQQVRTLLKTVNNVVVPQTRVNFLAALNLYQTRMDKNYSLTDCISMVTMQRRNIKDILTHDAGFRAEGFNILL